MSRAPFSLIADGYLVWRELTTSETATTTVTTLYGTIDTTGYVPAGQTATRTVFVFLNFNDVRNNPVIDHTLAWISYAMWIGWFALVITTLPKLL